MANADVITKAQLELEEVTSDLVNLVKVCDSINPDNPPPWLLMFLGRVIDLEKKVETYMQAVHARSD
jgi:hypothetical protein